MKEYSTDQNRELSSDTLKKAYTTPLLTKHGNVEILTLGAGSLNYDEGSLVEDLE